MRLPRLNSNNRLLLAQSIGSSERLTRLPNWTIAKIKREIERAETVDAASIQIDRLKATHRNIQHVVKSSQYGDSKVQSQGFWEQLRRFLAVAPDRSNGVPLNSQYRTPTPGNPDVNQAYNDPVTYPSADIAGNQYKKRDTRRDYPTPSVFAQADVASLLLTGCDQKTTPQTSVVAPLIDNKEQLVHALKQSSKSENFPPLAKPETKLKYESKIDTAYKLNSSQESGFPESYPCRSFT